MRGARINGKVPGIFRRSKYSQVMAASSHGLRTWCVSDSDEETDFGCDRSPSPPPLILRETSSDGEGEEVEKDKGGNHGCLVIGRRPLLPGQTPWEPIWSEPGQTEGQAGRNSQEFKHRKRCSKVTPLERVKPCKGEGRRYAADKNRERRQNRGNMPSQVMTQVQRCEVTVMWCSLSCSIRMS